MRTIVALAVVALIAVSAQTNSGDAIAKAAESQVGKWPYSWGGGNDNGATYGVKQSSSPYCDDRKVKGFDCSGLAKYSVYQGAGHSMVHHAQTQYNDCKNRVSISDKKAGDLVFFGDSTSSIHHVAIYVGDGMMVEAPGHDSHCNGIKVRKVTLRTSQLIQHACRMW